MRVNRQLQLELSRRFGFLTLEVGNGLTNHANVKIETNPLNVPALLTAEQVSGTTNFKVLEGHLHSTAEFIIGGDGREAVVSVIG